MLQIVVPFFAAAQAAGQAVDVYCVTLVILLPSGPLIAACRLLLLPLCLCKSVHSPMVACSLHSGMRCWQISLSS
jgi:hypothetical protein